MEKVIPIVPLRRWPAASFATPLNLIRRGTGSAGTTWDGEDTICPAACGSAATAVVAALFGAAGSCADRAGVGRRKNKLDTKTPRERVQMFIRSPTQIGAKWKHEGARRVNEEMGHSLMCGDRQELHSVKSGQTLTFAKSPFDQRPVRTALLNKVRLSLSNRLSPGLVL